MRSHGITAGGRKLPGGPVALFLCIALLSACSAQSSAVAPAVTQAATAVPTASPTDTPAPVPTNGTKPPPGLVLPTFFVTVTTSSNGALTVLTSAATRCTLSVRRPDGTLVDAGAQVTDAQGTAKWTYPPLADHGESIQTVTCTQADQTQTAKAQVLLP